MTLLRLWATVLLQVMEAAKTWWRLHRPLTFTEEQHLENPRVNIQPNHHELATKVAEAIKLGW